MTDGAVKTVLETNGVIYVGGSFNYIGPRRANGMLGLDAVTGEQVEVAPQVTGRIYTLVEDAQGGCFAGGSFKFVNSGKTNRFIHLRADRSVDPDWTPVFDNLIEGMTVHGSTLYVGGRFTHVNGQERNYSAAFDLRTRQLLPWKPDVFQPSTNVFWQTSGTNRIQIQAPISVRFMAAEGQSVFAVWYNGGPDCHINALDATTGKTLPWQPELPRAPNWFKWTSRALAVDNGKVFLALHQTFQLPRGGESYLAVLDAATGKLDTNYFGVRVAMINAIKKAGDEFVIAGDFFGVPRGQNFQELFQLNPGTLTTSGWEAGYIRSLKRKFGLTSAVAVAGRTAYVAGHFEQFAGARRAGLAAVNLDTGKLTDWDPGLLGHVDAMAVAGNTVYLDGLFLCSIGGRTRFNLAAIDAKTGKPLNWNPDPDGEVTSLAWANNTLQVSGSFTNIAGKLSAGFATLNPVTGDLMPGTSTVASFSNSAIQLQSKVQFVEIRLSNPAAPTSTQDVSLRLNASPGNLYVLEATTDLVHWTPIATNQAPFLVDEAGAVSSSPYRFYRLIPKTTSSSR